MADEETTNVFGAQKEGGERKLEVDVISGKKGCACAQAIAHSSPVGAMLWKLMLGSGGKIREWL